MYRVGAGAPKIPPSAKLSITTSRVKLVENASLRNWRSGGVETLCEQILAVLLLQRLWFWRMLVKWNFVMLIGISSKSNIMTDSYFHNDEKWAKNINHQ